MLNAYTSREQTAFHARVLKDDVPLALDMIADILTNPTFEQAELERERQVVLQELGQARDTPDDIVFDHLQAAIFQDQPLGWPILGEEETVNALHARRCCATYMAAQYRAGRHDPDRVRRGRRMTTIVRAGGREIRRPATRAGAGAAAGALCRRRFPRERGSGTGAYRLRLSGPVAMPIRIIYVAQIYATALGGGMSSRLFQEAREKRGLCYSIYAFSNGFQDCGFLGVYVGTGEKEAAEISAVIAGEMEAIAGKLTEAEVARARRSSKSRC